MIDRDLCLSVNTQEKDGDPKKFRYVNQLLSRHPLILPLWRDFGLMVRVSDRGKSKRQHMVTEHMITVSAGSYALGSMFQDRGLLTKTDLIQLEEAGLVHDTSKPLEVALVRASSAENPCLDEIRELVFGESIVTNRKKIGRTI